MRYPQILGVNRWQVYTAHTEFAHGGRLCTIRVVREWCNKTKTSAQDFEVTVEVQPGHGKSFRLIDARNVLLSEAECAGFASAHSAALKHPAWRPYDTDFSFYVGLMIDRLVDRSHEKEGQK